MDTIIKNQYFILDNKSYYLPLSFKDLSVVRYLNYIQAKEESEKAKALINCTKELETVLIVDILKQSEYLKKEIQQTELIEIKGEYKEYKNINPLLLPYAQYSFCAQILEKLYNSLDFIEDNTLTDFEKYNLTTINTINAYINIVACYSFDILNIEYKPEKLSEHIEIVKEMSVSDLYSAASFFLIKLKYAI